MSDVPDEAVEAAALAAYRASPDWHPIEGDQITNSWHQDQYLRQARAALIAALPHLNPPSDEEPTDTENAMLEAIRAHIKNTTGKEAYGAIVVLADTTPLSNVRDSNGGDVHHYRHGGFFACEGLLNLAVNRVTLEIGSTDDDS